MQQHHHFYIDGRWTDPTGQDFIDVFNPATEDIVTTIAAGRRTDVDKAVAAARSAFETYAWTTRAERLDLLNRIVEIYR